MIHLQISTDQANNLITDRVRFKIYAAEYELNGLKRLEQNGSTMASASNVPRVIWEMKMECLLAHLIGSVDSLLIRINDKLSLGMKIKDVNSSPPSMSEIKSRLNKRAGEKSNLLDPLDSVLDPGSDSLSPPKDPGWLWTLKDLRNQGMHRNLIPKHVSVHLYEDVNTRRSWSDKTRVSLKTVPQTDLEIIPYFEDSIEKTKNLIEDIMKKEPLFAS